MAFIGTTYSGAANRGTDRHIQIRRLDTGAIINVGGRTADFESSDKDTVEEIDGIDNGGRVDHIYHAGGVQAQFTINRFNDDFEQFAKEYNANYYRGGATIYVEIRTSTTNRFGPTDGTETYTMAVISNMKSGPWGPKKNPKVTFTVHAQERL